MVRDAGGLPEVRDEALLGVLPLIGIGDAQQRGGEASRRSHERPAGEVLLVSGLLADQHDEAWASPSPNTVWVASR